MAETEDERIARLVREEVERVAAQRRAELPERMERDRREAEQERRAGGNGRG